MYLFDLDYRSPGINLTSSSSNSAVVFMCAMEMFNCLAIDPQCSTCTSRSLCSACIAPYLLQVYPNVTSQCLLCR